MNFDDAFSREWIETNGLGGWASSTVSFASSRRYHGMLVAADERGQRRVVVAKLDETVGTFELATNRYPGAIHPRGFELLQSFRRKTFPEWEYTAGDVRLRKTVVAPRGENTTIIVYEVLDAPEPFPMRLRPFLAGRDYHSLQHRADGWSEPLVFVSIPGATFESKPDWYYNFEYAIEIERGLDAYEDLFTPGEYVVTLKAGDVLPVMLAMEDPDGRDALAIVAAERARRSALCSVLGPAARSTEHRALVLAADQFILTRDTIIAGYHWFTDWGRDTMISLPGLCLATGRFDDARRILRRWCRASSKGMIPNRFPDGGAPAEYNSVDAALWMFVAAWRYIEATGDDAFVRDEILPFLRDAIKWLTHGTRYNIHVDDDGLLYAGAGGVQLTWMDAKVGDEVCTPRRGKAVEVNALWYNALRITARLTESPELDTHADAVRRTFESAFWNEERGCAFDVIGDPTIRPNQLIALSLPFPLFDDERGRRIVDVCRAKLLTPVGLRTLDPDDPRYVGRLVGPQRERDFAYHQGTVWPWLLGPYIDAIVRLNGEEGRAEGRELLANLERHMHEEACIGQISEVFDGDPPHTPRGCIAQAWSVAETLRLLSTVMRQ